MFRRRKTQIAQTERLTLRLPEATDFTEWADLRRDSAEFLAPWEPVRDGAYLTRRSFQNRIIWAKRSAKDRRALNMLIFRRDDGCLIGGITLDNIQGGVSKSCTVGYWMGESFTRQGYMAEALNASVQHAFTVLDISRIQAGCLPENAPSRALLEKSGFKYEGVAQSYLQIAGRWRNHVLYANLRRDRRGRTD
ncbi:MAG: 30S ribosomal protein S5 alanine N-acetyltransferase [Rhodobacteraceae bacterium]|nr:MAG: 30S ribosomal protein S5 alanine N-acetyltransferase [Paracoccaceae bacterium]